MRSNSVVSNINKYNILSNSKEKEELYDKYNLMRMNKHKKSYSRNIYNRNLGNRSSDTKIDGSEINTSQNRLLINRKAELTRDRRNLLRIDLMNIIKKLEDENFGANKDKDETMTNIERN